MVVDDLAQAVEHEEQADLLADRDRQAAADLEPPSDRFSMTQSKSVLAIVTVAGMWIATREAARRLTSSDSTIAGECAGRPM